MIVVVRDAKNTVFQKVLVMGDAKELSGSI